VWVCQLCEWSGLLQLGREGRAHTSAEHQRSPTRRTAPVLHSTSRVRSCGGWHPPARTACLQAHCRGAGCGVMPKLQQAVCGCSTTTVTEGCTRVPACSPLLEGLSTRSGCCSLRPLALPLPLPSRTPRAVAVPAASAAWGCGPTAGAAVNRARAQHRAAKAGTLARPTTALRFEPPGTEVTFMAKTAGTNTPGH
jgi:hypothetical protein